MAAGVWLLVEDGLLSFKDPVALHIPEFARRQGRHHDPPGR